MSYSKNLSPKPASQWTQCLVFSSLAASLGSFIFGYNLSVIDAPAEIFTKCVKEDAVSGFPLCVNVYGFWNFVVTIFCIGGLVGALSASPITNWAGRQKALLYNTIIFMAGGLLMSLATNLIMLLSGRFLIGFASGLTACAVPMFLSEIAPDSIRGRVASFHQCMLVIGIIVAQLLAFPFVEPGTQSWRILFFTTTFLASIQFLLMTFVPESPAFLLSKGSTEALENSLCRLQNSSDVSDQILQLQNRSAQTQEKPLSLLELLRLKEARRSIQVASFSHLAQQLSGINAYFFYATTIFSGVNLPFSLKFVPLIFGIVNATLSCSSVFFIDRTGRRSLLLWSTILCIATSACMIMGFAFNLTLLKIVSAILFIAGFAIGLGPVPWIIMGDIFPSEAISSGTSLAITINWICNSIVAFGTEGLCNILGPFAFAPFLCVLVAYLFFVLARVSETKGTRPHYL